MKKEFGQLLQSFSLHFTTFVLCTCEYVCKVKLTETVSEIVPGDLMHI